MKASFTINLRISTVVMLAVVFSLSFSHGALTAPHRLVENQFPNQLVRGAVLNGSYFNSRQGTDPAKVSAAIRANAQALRAFAWQQRMQLQVKGETKK